MQKYYAVRNGKNRGIYNSWKACKEQVSGVSGAVYKSFKTWKAANKWLQSGGKVGKLIYAIAAGRIVGIVDSWEKCQESVLGYKNPKYRGFKNKAAAVKWLKENNRRDNP